MVEKAIIMLLREKPAQDSNWELVRTDLINKGRTLGSQLITILNNLFLKMIYVVSAKNAQGHAEALAYVYGLTDQLQHSFLITKEQVSVVQDKILGIDEKTQQNDSELVNQLLYAASPESQTEDIYSFIYSFITEQVDGTIFVFVINEKEYPSVCAQFFKETDANRGNDKDFLARNPNQIVILTWNKEDDTYVPEIKTIL